MKILFRVPTRGWLLQLEFKLEDAWIGVFWKNTPDRLDVWLCLLPCLPLHYASPVYDDPADDPEYQKFVESQANHCRCSRDKPCDGVLAGGPCDDVQDDDLDDMELDVFYDDEDE